MSDTETRPFYRAVMMGLGLAILAWLRTHNQFNTALVGVLTAVAVLGIEWGWWVRAGDHLPAAWERLRSLVIGLLSWLPPARVQLQPYDVVFGWQADNPRRPVVGNLKRMKSFLIVAVNGAGKTSLAHSAIHDIILSNGPDQLNLVIIDPKGGQHSQGKDFDIYERLPHLLWPIASKPDDVKRSLTCLQKLMDERARLFACMPKGRICNELDRYNYINETEELGLPRLAPVLVFIDEVQRVIKHYKAGPLLEDIAATGRSYGVFIVPITQTPKVDSLPTEIKSQCYSRFIGKMASASLYGHIAEVPQEIYKEHTLRDHQFFVRFEGGEWQVMTANLIPYDELERVAGLRSEGQQVPAWPVNLATATDRNGTAMDRNATAMLPQRPPQQVVDWSALKTDPEKEARLRLYLSRFTERPSALETLDDINWSKRTAETWLARVWPIQETMD